MKAESYYLIRDVLQKGFWNRYEQRFRGINYAYKINVNAEIAFDEEFQKARGQAKCGVELVRIYT